MGHTPSTTATKRRGREEISGKKRATNGYM
jgi:hypothetical protein